MAGQNRGLIDQSKYLLAGHFDQTLILLFLGSPVQVIKMLPAIYH
jgi:hypothetical protein